MVGGLVEWFSGTGGRGSGDIGSGGWFGRVVGWLIGAVLGDRK